MTAPFAYNAVPIPRPQLLPLMLFWFSLNVPSGLALYYVVNTSATIGIQYWLKNLGGTKVEINAPEVTETRDVSEPHVMRRSAQKG